MKNILTQWKTEEENQKTSGDVLLIDREYSGNILLLDGKYNGNVLLIDRNFVELEDDAECASFPKLTKLEDVAECASLPKLTELEDDAECASLPKLIELVKKPSNLTRTGKEKPHCPISHSLACFVQPIR